uniref:UDP-N-acetylglucosamine 4-epimerase n=1 Tax=Phallusia mammillata TaxID=59560 RepID=A0A6F9DCP9_9ASCI|nr:UDP-glucose 4-epimerase [Phallusia mammillata]
MEGIRSDFPPSPDTDVGSPSTSSECDVPCVFSGPKRIFHPFSSKKVKNDGKKLIMDDYILVTGGAGYIGCHTVLELLECGYQPIVIDNCCNATCDGVESTPESLKRIKQITGKEVTFKYIDLLDKPRLLALFKEFKFNAVMHFAGLKSVNESIAKPMDYYEVNIGGTINLVECMKEFNVKNMVFSSSATVYGPPVKLPVAETHPVGKGLTNPYGKTKFFIEEILRDLANAEEGWRIMILRYFNPVGSHISGLIGEDPQGTPGNLMPYVAQVAVGRLPILSVFGNDYKTHDGTGVRDFIHVVDLAKGHIAALQKLSEIEGSKAINLGTGHGYSVLDAVKAFERASQRDVPFKFAPRRPGDLGCVYADPSLAEKLLNWKASRTLDDMCVDLWRWQSKHPNGYKTEPNGNLKTS